MPRVQADKERVNTMPRRTKISFKTEDGRRVTFFKPPRKPCASCRRTIENELEAEKQGNMDLRAIGMVLILILMMGYGLVMFGLGYLLRDSLCTGLLVMT